MAAVFLLVLAVLVATAAELGLIGLPSVVEISIVVVAVGIVLLRLVLGRVEQSMRHERPDWIRNIEDRVERESEVMGDFDALAHVEDVIVSEPLSDESPSPFPSLLPSERYANVALTDPEGRRPVVAKPGEVVLIEVNIGPRWFYTDVVDGTPQPFPDELLPEQDLELTVLLSSSEMEVGAGVALGSEHGEHTVEQKLTLPGRTAPSVKSEILRFALRLPLEFRRSRARLSYLYRDTVIQSQRLDLVATQPFDEKDVCEVQLFATTDFTLSENLADDLEEIVPRRRVSVVANSNPGQVHEITVRSPGVEGAGPKSVAFQIDEEGVARVAARMRRQLHVRASKSRARSVRDLKNDLRRLAPIGWELFAQIEFGARRLVEGAVDGGVVQVAMLRESGFSLPWNFVYDIYIDSDVEPSRLDVCPVVHRLGRDLMIDADTRLCPCEEEVSHRENLLCPFGFWGYRYSFELLMSGKAPKTEIVLGDAGRIVAAKTETGVNGRRLKGHLSRLSERFQRHDPALTLSEASTKPDVRSELSVDLPFVYFICHGFKDRSGATVLGIGRRENIRPTDIDGWVETVYRESEHRLWTEPQPLIFINACASLAINPKDLAGYLEAFIGTAQAVGVIGTEARVSQKLAMEVGETFFDRLLNPSATVDSSLRDVKASFLNDRNLIGLFYTSYCFADLHVSSATE